MGSQWNNAPGSDTERAEAASAWIIREHPAFMQCIGRKILLIASNY